MPLWQGKHVAQSKSFVCPLYANSKRKFNRNNTHQVRNNYKFRSDTVTLTPLPQKIKSKMMEYHAWHVTGSVKGIALDCMSYKANNKNSSTS